MLRASGLSAQGRIRSTNEDCFAIDEPLGLCLVADGVGGHNAGEVAARMAVEAVLEHLRRSRDDPTDWPFGFDPDLSAEGNSLRTAVHLANVQVLEAAIDAAHCAGMGTTLVAARAWQDRLCVAHVGDSRLYLLSDGRLRQVTRDDSWVTTVLAQDPDADPLVLRHHPMRNALTNVVGARARTEVHVIEEPLAGGETLLLSTDGVHGVLDERHLARLLLEYADPEATAGTIVAAALAAGSRDNCTAIVARYTV